MKIPRTAAMSHTCIFSSSWKVHCSVIHLSCSAPSPAIPMLYRSVAVCIQTIQLYYCGACRPAPYSLRYAIDQQFCTCDSLGFFQSIWFSVPFDSNGKYGTAWCAGTAVYSWIRAFLVNAHIVKFSVGITGGWGFDPLVDVFNPLFCHLCWP